MSTESDNQNGGVRTRKEMTANAKYLNVAVLLILLGVAAYVIFRTVNDIGGVVLFTYHPTFIVLGVSMHVYNLTWHS
jgi:NADH:ubiquinone oxidoreductase subunit 3 (subunit A)